MIYTAMDISRVTKITPRRVTRYLAEMKIKQVGGAYVFEKPDYEKLIEKIKKMISQKNKYIPNTKK